MESLQSDGCRFCYAQKQELLFSNGKSSLSHCWYDKSMYVNIYNNDIHTFGINIIIGIYGIYVPNWPHRVQW